MTTLLSVKKDKNHIVINLFGMKIKFRAKQSLRNSQIEQSKILKEIVKTYIKSSKTNYEVFNKYKNINTGKTVVLCGSGPSLSSYSPMEGAIHCSLNRAFENENIKFDYLFVCDWNGIKISKERFKNYHGIKFIGCGMRNPIENIPQDYINSFKCEKFFIEQYWTDYSGEIDLPLDLDMQPVAMGNTVAIPAMQFLLWTNPKKIYIVGCDCAPNGHFCPMTEEFEQIYQKSIQNDCYVKMLKEWQSIKRFAETYYPETEIISVNPIGLKGLFSDLYTK